MNLLKYIIPLFVLFVTFSTSGLLAQEEMAGAEQNKMLTKKIPMEIINKGNFELIPELFSPEFVNHTPPPGVPAKGHEAIKALFTMLRTGFPDIKLTLEHSIAEGDHVVQHVTAMGTHKGELMGNAATNKQAQWQEIHILRLKDGKVVEHWGVVDTMSMMMQLGLKPPEQMTDKM